MQALRTVVIATIRETVNGKIDKIERKLDAHIRVTEAHMREVTPIVTTFTFVKTRAFKVALPFFAGLIGMDILVRIFAS